MALTSHPLDERAPASEAHLSTEFCRDRGEDSPKKYFLRVIPTLAQYSDIVSAYHLEVSIYGSTWHICSDLFSDILSSIYSDILSGILSGIYSGIHSGILPGIYSDILTGILSDIYNSAWHSI